MEGMEALIERGTWFAIPSYLLISGNMRNLIGLNVLVYIPCGLESDTEELLGSTLIR